MSIKVFLGIVSFSGIVHMSYAAQNPNQSMCLKQSMNQLFTNNVQPNFLYVYQDPVFFKDCYDNTVRGSVTNYNSKKGRSSSKAQKGQNRYNALTIRINKQPFNHIYKPIPVYKADDITHLNKLQQYIPVDNPFYNMYGPINAIILDKKYQPV